MTQLGGDVAKVKVAATALLTGPGLPFVYYGEEIGMTGTKPDPHLRTPMQWTDAAAGFTSGTPWEPFQPDLATVNVAAQAGDPSSLLNHYRRLIQLHAASPALAHGVFVPLAGPTAVAAYLRVAPEQTVLVVINFSDDPENGIDLTAAAGSLPPGEYVLSPLLGEAAGAPLMVGTDGGFAGYVPLPSGPLAPLTGYVFEVGAAGG
jgi:glycosidase